MLNQKVAFALERLGFSEFFFRKEVLGEGDLPLRMIHKLKAFYNFQCNSEFEFAQNDMRLSCVLFPIIYHSNRLFFRRKVSIVRCLKCQFENREGNRFHKECGNKLELTSLVVEMPIQGARNFSMNVGNR